jgi:transcriptional regulator with XRE-family HTH domain
MTQVVTFGDEIRVRRQRLGLSQQQVAEAVGVERVTISRWESGIRAPTRESLSRLLEIYGATDAELSEILRLPRHAPVDSHVPPPLNNHRAKRRTGPSQRITPNKRYGATGEVSAPNPPQSRTPPTEPPAASPSGRCTSCAGTGQREGDECASCLGTGRRYEA